MKITLHQVTIGELVEGYADRSENEEGITGLGGRLNIRPKYQREFVYGMKERNAVMDTVWRGFPLNVMYWVRTTPEVEGAPLDGKFELLDGQQRTISICQFVYGEYMMVFDGTLTNFDGLTPEQKKRILDYPLQIYICDGPEEEQIAWFKVINIAGERLTEQEMRNAVYSGPWVTQAKRRFSKTNCVAYQQGRDYMAGAPIRQAYLETVLKWISRGEIDAYMVKHRFDPDCDELWQYYQNVIHWVQMHFTERRREMKGVAWGDIYNLYRDAPFKESELRERVRALMKDSDVQSKAGIYWYVFDGDERHLDIRAFDGNTKREVYERQEGICPGCGKHFELEEMEADHIKPWRDGGRTIAENCQMLCRDCNRRKGAK